MDIKVPFEFNDNMRNFLRRCGYAEFSDYNTGKTSYVRRLMRDNYPRFHVYINEKDAQKFISLHLDQKKPSYAGSHAHSGEYDGVTVEQEMSRISGLLQNQMHNQNQSNLPEKPKGLFHKIFKF